MATAIATQFSDFYPLMTPELPGCDTPVILQALQKTARTFCQDTEVWREELPPVRIVDYQQDYALSHTFNATVRRILWLRLNGKTVEPNDYDVFDDGTVSRLRFRSAAVPTTNLVDQLLVCGTAGIITVVGWQAITDGSVTFTVSDSTYAVTGLNFATDTTFAAIAQRIQTALRLAMDSNTVLVRFIAGTGFNYFTVYSEESEVSYLTAGSSGTSIAGAGHMNGLTGGTGVALGPLGLVKAVLVPFLAIDTLPDPIMERYSDGIVAGAMQTLLSMEDVKWAKPKRAMQYGLEYRKHWNKARAENVRVLKSFDGVLSA